MNFLVGNDSALHWLELCFTAKLIILDEPTSALDRSTQRAMIQLLRRLQQQEK